MHCFPLWLLLQNKILKMKSRLIDSDKRKTFILVFDTGDEVMEELVAFAEKNNMRSGHFTAIGAFSKAILGFFDFSIKDYKKIQVSEQAEGLMLSGNISIHENKPKVHCHAILGKSDGSVIGGHFLNARVKP